MNINCFKQDIDNHWYPADISQVKEFMKLRLHEFMRDDVGAVETIGDNKVVLDFKQYNKAILLINPNDKVEDKFKGKVEYILIKKEDHIYLDISVTPEKDPPYSIFVSGSLDELCSIFKLHRLLNIYFKQSVLPEITYFDYYKLSYNDVRDIFYS